MAKPDSSKKERKKTVRWVFTIFVVTLLISGVISFTSEIIMGRSSMAIAFLILLIIVLIGIVFDVIGVAVTSADEKPFHSMAAKKVPGAQESIRLLRKAEKVSSICNDVIGDICGVVSGSAAATIAAAVIANFECSIPRIITLSMSATVAAVTVGGKAIGKTFAIGSCTQIVYTVGKILWAKGHLWELITNKKKKD